MADQEIQIVNLPRSYIGIDDKMTYEESIILLASQDWTNFSGTYGGNHSIRGSLLTWARVGIIRDGIIKGYVGRCVKNTGTQYDLGVYINGIDILNVQFPSGATGVIHDLTEVAYLAGDNILLRLFENASSGTMEGYTTMLGVNT